MSTHTGNFPIGFRQGWTDWQKDLAGLITWAQASGFAAIDTGADPESVKAIHAAGLGIGSVDLPGWGDMISADAAKRQAGVANALAVVKACVGYGATNFFCVMLPEDPRRPRKENFAWMVESFSALATMIEPLGAKFVVEGYPGPGALCCTPADLREFFRQIPSKAAAINYDPSHLIRLGIDHVRFLEEFAPRVAHVHGKDAEIIPERLFDHGTELSPTFDRHIRFGGNHWRYTIPGHGCTRWTKIFSILKSIGYSGRVCIELEDENFNTGESGEKRGLLASRAFLETC